AAKAAPLFVGRCVQGGFLTRICAGGRGSFFRFAGRNLGLLEVCRRLLWCVSWRPVGLVGGAAAPAMVRGGGVGGRRPGFGDMDVAEKPPWTGSRRPGRGPPTPPPPTQPPATAEGPALHRHQQSRPQRRHPPIAMRMTCAKAPRGLRGDALVPTGGVGTWPDQFPSTRACPCPPPRPRTA